MVKQRYAYFAAICIVILISLQSGITDGKNEITFNVDSTVFYFINYFLWAFLLPVIERIFLTKKVRDNNFPIIAIQCLLLILFHFLFSNLIYFLSKLFYEPLQIQEFITLTSNYLIESSFRRIIDLTLIIVIVKAIDNYRISLQRKEKLEMLNRQLQETKFEVLKSQLNPHFLFNALHSVYTMIGYEDKKAKNMTLRMSNLLRKMLDDSVNQYTVFSEELDFVMDYLAIEKERFHDRLEVKMEIDEKSKSVSVPRLLLQPLVENAIKHGIALLEEGGTIEIRSAIKKNDLDIYVLNPIPGDLESPSSIGIGLKNLKERLISLNPDYSILTKKNENSFEVLVQLKGLIQ